MKKLLRATDRIAVRRPDSGEREGMCPLALLGTLSAAILIASSALAQAADYPSKPIRIIVPFPPGGGADITTRIVAQHLGSLGQPVLTENRPGAGGVVGTVLAAKAPADGYTLLMAVAAHVINPSLFRNVEYDPVRDFSPITMAYTFPYLLVVPNNLPVNNVNELIALARSQPGKVTFASAGTGGGNHMAGEMLKVMAKVNIVHVPYKGGALAMNDIIGGHVSMLFGTVIETFPQVRAGKLKAIGISSAKRSSVAPELPTISESALPGYEATGWYSFAAPAGTPTAVIGSLNREITRILAFPEVNKQLVGGETWPTTPEKAQEVYVTEWARWTKVIKESGIKPE